jgi:hypothetical protein
MPASGRLNVWSYLECVESNYYGYLSDEFGWSNADVTQSSRYFMTIGNGPDPDHASFPLMYYHRGGNEGNWFDNIAQPSEIRYFNLISSISYSAGQWVLMLTGISDSQLAIMNDMDISSYIRNKWIIRKLAVSAINP